MSYTSEIASLREKYIKAVQVLSVDNNADDKTWLFLHLIGSKIDYLETAEAGNVRDAVFQSVEMNLWEFVYSYVSDNDNDVLSFTALVPIVIVQEISSDPVYLEQIVATNIAALTSQYYIHFTTAYLWYVSTLTNFSDDHEWLLAYRLQMLLRHLEIQNALGLAPDEGFVDCLYSYFPDNGNYGNFGLDFDPDGIVIQDPQIFVPPVPGVQNLFLTIQGILGK
jgi:hypothetical protein